MQTISQKKLAQELGITDRRIRQLVEEKILPPLNEAGGYDARLCSDRYRLFSRGNEEAWDRFYDQLEADAGEVDKLLKRALRPKARSKELAAAAQALVSAFERVRFGLAAKCRSKPEYPLLMRALDAEERAAFAPLYARTVEFLHGQKTAS